MGKELIGRSAMDARNILAEVGIYSQQPSEGWVVIVARGLQVLERSLL